MSRLRILMFQLAAAFMLEVVFQQTSRPHPWPSLPTVPTLCDPPLGRDGALGLASTNGMQKR